MKILYWSPYVGHVGTIKAVVNSAAAMKAYGGHDVAIVRNHSEWEGCEARISEAGVRIVDFGLKKRFPNLRRVTAIGSRLYMLTVAFFGFFQLAAYMRREKPDVVIANLLTVPAILATMTVRPVPKVIASIQGFPKFLGTGLRTSYPLWMKAEDALRKWLWNVVYPRADLVVCMTGSTREKLLKAVSLPEERLIQVNNPVVDEQIFALSAASLEDPWFLGDGCRRVVAVGRLTRQKDFVTLIRAIEVAAKEVSLRLAVLGEGEDRQMLEAEIKNRGLEERIRLYGFVPNPYVYLRRADLFVQTSLWEDPGHALLEAAALRVPVVSTDCPTGPASLLSNGAGGELCPVGDVECLAHKIVSVLRAPDANKTQVAYDNASRFSLRAHFDVLAPHIERWRNEA